MKHFVIIALLLLSWNSLHSQINFGVINIIPATPTADDTIKIAVTTTLGTPGSRLSYYVTTNSDSVKIYGCYYMDGVINGSTAFYDTTQIGVLPFGTYIIDYKACDSNINPFGCSNSFCSHHTQTFNVLLGIEKISDFLSVYPNPVIENLIIKNTKLLTEYYIKITNSLGLVCFTGTFSNEKNIDLSNFKSGIYTLSILDDKVKYMYKIVKS